MRRMVSTYHSDSSIVEGFAQGLPITFCLDGRITFDTGTKSGIVTITEIEMRDCSLSGDGWIISK